MDNGYEDDAIELGTEGRVSVKKMNKDILKAAITLTADEARFLVAAYYMQQESRKRARNQERALLQQNKPNAILTWLSVQSETLEKQIKKTLDLYTSNHVMGSWMRDIYGIGPVLSAGILAHIDIDQCPTAGHIWSYAGYNPGQIWEAKDDVKKWLMKEKIMLNDSDIAYGLAAAHYMRKIETLRKFAENDKDGQPQKLTLESLAKALARRPYNADFKTLCWKIGQSFMKFSNVKACYYGSIYRERKAQEVMRNEQGLFKHIADKKVVEDKYGKTTDAYAAYIKGKLPPAELDGRARRYAVKLFLAHLHEVWYEKHFGKPAPLPYPIAFLGHAHKIDPPGK